MFAVLRNTAGVLAFAYRREAAELAVTWGQRRTDCDARRRGTPDGAALESDAALLAGNLARPSCGGAARRCSSWPTLPVIRRGRPAAATSVRERRSAYGTGQGTSTSNDASLPSISPSARPRSCPEEAALANFTCKLWPS